MHDVNVTLLNVNFSGKFWDLVDKRIFGRKDDKKYLPEDITNKSNSVSRLKDKLDVSLDERINGALLLLNEGDNSDNILGRLNRRETIQKIKEEYNLETILFKASEQYSDEEQASEQEVSEDWLYKYIDHAKSISEETIQNLWARILAQEVKFPKSFSIKTLNLLSQIDKSDAKSIEHVFAHRISIADYAFFIKNYFNGRTSHHFEISHKAFSLCEQLGLIQSQADMELEVIKWKGTDSKNPTVYDSYFTLIVGDYSFSFGHRNFKNDDRLLKIYFITDVGQEISKLVKYKADKYYQEFIFKDINKYMPNIPWLKYVKADFSSLEDSDEYKEIMNRTLPDTPINKK